VIQASTSPAALTLIEFKTSGFAAPLTSEVLPSSILYIEAIGTDLNENISDTLLVYLINNNMSVANPGCSIPVILVERNSNSGKFQGTAQLGEATNRTAGILKAEYGESITAYSTDKADTVNITVPASPERFDNIRFMGTNYLSVLTGAVSSNTVLYVEVNGSDANELTADTLECYCSSPESLSAITIVLTETNSNTGKYRGIFELKSYTDDSTDYLKAEESGCTILVRVTNSSGADTQEDTVVIQLPTSPSAITIMEFKKPGYSSTLTGDVLPGSVLYIEAIAADLNVNTSDTLSVYLINNNIPPVNESCSIQLILIETNSNSGRFRGTGQLGSVTNRTLDILAAAAGDSITVYSLNKADTVFVTVPSAPERVDNLNFMSAGYSSVLSGAVTVNSMLYVEANGTDGNELTADTLECYCSSPESASNITVTLTETGNNTGRYRGTFRLMSYTEDLLDYLEAEDSGSVITVQALHATGADTIDTVVIQLPVEPTVITNIYFKTSFACIVPITPATAPNIPASWEVGTSPGGGGSGKRHL